LIEQLEDRIKFLESELAATQEENTKLRSLVLHTMERIDEGNRKMAESLPTYYEPRFKKPKWVDDEG